MAENYLKEIRCSNCQQGHLAYARSCDIDKKEKETLKEKPKMNLSFQKARKTVGFFYGRKHASDGWRGDPINQENEYRALVEKRIQLELNDWPKFQDHLKKTYTRPNFSKHKLNKKLEM